MIGYLLRPCRPSAVESAGYTGRMEPEAGDPGIARAGAAVAARRRELDIKQRNLAKVKIIKPGALIAFEKGRSWPRERTRAKLEEILQWPAGTIATIRYGGQIPGAAAGAPAGRGPPRTP